MKTNEPYGIKQFCGKIDAMAFRNAAEAIEETVSRMDAILRISKPDLPGMDWDEFYVQHAGVKDVKELLLKIADGMDAAIREGATGLTVQLVVDKGQDPYEGCERPTEPAKQATSPDSLDDTKAIMAAIQRLMNISNKIPRE